MLLLSPKLTIEDHIIALTTDLDLDHVMVRRRRFPRLVIYRYFDTYISF